MTHVNEKQLTAWLLNRYFEAVPVLRGRLALRTNICQYFAEEIFTLLKETINNLAYFDKIAVNMQINMPSYLAVSPKFLAAEVGAFN